MAISPFWSFEHLNFNIVSDFDNLKVSYQSEMLELPQEVSRVYDLNKRFIGLMFTMAIGIIGYDVTNFMKTGKSEES